MNEKKEQMDWSGWFSTYGLLTAERILGQYNIHLKHEELFKVVKDTDSIYYQLLRAPLKHIFNGIILTQALDYQIYAQKLFVDYLMSGQDAKEAGSPGSATREELEQQRLLLVEMGANFRKVEMAHKQLIAETQSALIELSRDLNLLLQMEGSNIREIESILSAYIDRAEEDGCNLRAYRKQFYDLILHVTELLKTVPDYHIDQVKEADNLSALAFDATIGE